MLAFDRKAPGYKLRCISVSSAMAEEMPAFRLPDVMVTYLGTLVNEQLTSIEVTEPPRQLATLTFANEGYALFVEGLSTVRKIYAQSVRLDILIRDPLGFNSMWNITLSTCNSDAFIVVGQSIPVTGNGVDKFSVEIWGE